MFSWYKETYRIHSWVGSRFYFYRLFFTYATVLLCFLYVVTQSIFLYTQNKVFPPVYVLLMWQLNIICIIRQNKEKVVRNYYDSSVGIEIYFDKKWWDLHLCLSSEKQMPWKGYPLTHIKKNYLYIVNVYV